MLNKREIVERVHHKLQSNPGFYLCSDVEHILTAVGYFDLLEAARDMAMQHRYTSPMDNHEKVYCFECHREWTKHKSTCSTGAVIEILKKMGVEVD